MMMQFMLFFHIYYEARAKCLRRLQYKSLLTYDPHTQRYRYYQLIKKFFSQVTLDLMVEQEQFSDHFAIYVTLYCGVALPDIKAKHHLEAFQILDLERYNFEYLFTMHVSVERHAI